MKHSLLIGYILKYSDTFFAAGRDTIVEHNQLLKRKGQVWVGKAGVPISPRSLARCRPSDSVAFRLLMLRTRGKGGAKIFNARLVKAQQKKPPARLIPVYYRTRRDMNTWFCIDTELRAMSAEEIASWVIVSSGEPLLETAARSMQTYFVATKESHLAQARKFLGKPQQGVKSSGGRNASLQEWSDDGESDGDFENSRTIFTAP
jgi:hypothetical protein